MEDVGCRARGRGQNGARFRAGEEGAVTGSQRQGFEGGKGKRGIELVSQESGGARGVLAYGRKRCGKPRPSRVREPNITIVDADRERLGGRERDVRRRVHQVGPGVEAHEAEALSVIGKKGIEAMQSPGWARVITARVG